MSETQSGELQVELQTTRPGRTWLIKSLAIIIALVAFGFWALYDATVLYPARGARFAEFSELQYLQNFETTGSFRNAPVPDPVATHRSLKEKLAEVGELTPVEQVRYTWLDALAIIGRLNADSAVALNDSPRGRLDALQETWGEDAQTPGRLASFDIPSQWLILIVCWGIALWLLMIFVPAVLRKYKWDPASKRLHLPGGATLVPSDIAEFDKRKWEKFLVFLRIGEGHESLGGKELKLDLYRHNPLESWILEMERIAFPEQASESAGQDDDTQEAGAPKAAEASA